LQKESDKSSGSKSMNWPWVVTCWFGVQSKTPQKEQVTPFS